jgi:hypothetical protein
MHNIQFLYYPIYFRASLGRWVHIPLRVGRPFFYDREWRVFVKLMLWKSLRTGMCPGVEMVIENLTRQTLEINRKAPGMTNA